MDKQTESREQFETWLKENRPLLFVQGRLGIMGGWIYDDVKTNNLWAVWTASRESFVVELPKSGFYLGYGCPEYMEKDDVIDVIRAIGIRIKGEGV